MAQLASRIAEGSVQSLVSCQGVKLVAEEVRRSQDVEDAQPPKVWKASSRFLLKLWKVKVDVV